MKNENACVMLNERLINKLGQYFTISGFIDAIGDDYKEGMWLDFVKFAHKFCLIDGEYDLALAEEAFEAWCKQCKDLA